MAKKAIRQELYNDTMGFGKLLNQLRVDKGLNQREVADYLGIKAVTVSAYERGRIIPTPDKIYRLSRLFGVNLDVMSTKIVEGQDENAPDIAIPELEEAKRQVAKMDEMLYYFKNLSAAQQAAVTNLARRLSESA